MEKLKLTMTTAVGGAGTATSTDMQGVARGVRGRVVSIQYDKPASNGFDNGSTMTLTGAESGLTVWAETGVNADALRFPRQQAHSAAGVGIAWYEPMPLAGELLLMTVSGGGDAKDATWYVVVE